MLGFFPKCCRVNLRREEEGRKRGRGRVGGLAVRFHYNSGRIHLNPALCVCVCVCVVASFTFMCFFLSPTLADCSCESPVPPSQGIKPPSGSSQPVLPPWCPSLWWTSLGGWCCLCLGALGGLLWLTSCLPSFGSSAYWTWFFCLFLAAPGPTQTS